MCVCVCVGGGVFYQGLHCTKSMLMCKEAHWHSADKVCADVKTSSLTQATDKVYASVQTSTSTQATDKVYASVQTSTSTQATDKVHAHVQTSSLAFNYEVCAGVQRSSLIFN